MKAFEDFGGTHVGVFVLQAVIKIEVIPHLLARWPTIVHPQRDHLAFFFGFADQGRVIQSRIGNAFFSAARHRQKQRKDDQVPSNSPSLGGVPLS
jgi:hypothetical protein